MSLGYIIDKFHDKHGFSHTGSTEQTNLTALHIRLEQVYDLDTCGKHLLVCGQILKLRRLAVNGICTLHVEFCHTVDRLSYHIHHASLNLFAGWHDYRASCCRHLKTALQSVSVVHSHTTYSVLAYMLLNLDNKLATVRTYYLQSIVYFRQHFLCFLSLRFKVNVYNRTDYLRNMACCLCHSYYFLMLFQLFAKLTIYFIRSKL